MNLKGFFFKHCSIFKIPAVWNSFNILPHSFQFVKYFFQVFFQTFLNACFFRNNFYIISLSYELVKPFFKKVFVLFLSRSLSFDSFIIISPLSFFVNDFFVIWRIAHNIALFSQTYIKYDKNFIEYIKNTAEINQQYFHLRYLYKLLLSVIPNYPQSKAP